MKILSDKYNKATGSLGDLTFSMAGNSIVVRKKANPSNPNTNRQIQIREALAAANVTWKIMTQVARDKWELHAATLKSKDALGVVKKVSGWSSFAGAYVLNKQAILSLDDLITGDKLKDGYLPSSGFDLVGGSGVITIENNSGETRRVSMYVSDPVSQTINNNGAGYHFLDSKVMTSPDSFSFDGVNYASKKIFVKFQCLDGFGNISQPTIKNLSLGAISNKNKHEKEK